MDSCPNCNHRPCRCYHIHCRRGKKGDKGDPGTNGRNGTKGDKGTNGTKGDKGDPGKDGTNGTKGDPGKDGTNGTKGDKGDPGTKGDKGDPGTNGDKGDPGTSGTNGTKGDKGDPGTKGDKGDPGTKGDKGDPGTSGTNGTKGDKGDPGSSIDIFTKINTSGSTLLGKITVPQGVKKCHLICIGAPSAGGSGLKYSSLGDRGGSGGGSTGLISKCTTPVTPGDIISYSIGTAGVPIAEQNGTDGEPTFAIISSLALQTFDGVLTQNNVPVCYADGAKGGEIPTHVMSGGNSGKGLFTGGGGMPNGQSAPSAAYNGEGGLGTLTASGKGGGYFGALGVTTSNPEHFCGGSGSSPPLPFLGIPGKGGSYNIGGMPLPGEDGTLCAPSGGGCQGTEFYTRGSMAGKCTGGGYFSCEFE